MNTLSIPVSMIASISLYVGFYHFLIYMRRRHRREDLTFALLCLGASIYDIFCIGLYHATSSAEGARWQRAQFAALAFFTTTFLWFVCDYTRLKAGKVIYAFSAFFMAAAIVQLMDRTSLTWKLDTPSTKTILLPWGSQIVYHEAALGLFTTIQSLAGLLASIYILLLSIRFYRSGHQRRASWLLTAILCTFAAAANDFAVANGFYQFIYTIEYGYMAMISLMAYSLSNDVIEAAILKSDLQKSEERLRTLIETTSDWVWETDVSGIYTYASPKVHELLGYEPDEILGKTAFELMPPEEAERVQHIFSEIVARQEAITRLENIARHKEGHLVVLETSGVPFFDAKGILLGYRGIDRDVTDRKRAQEALWQANLVVEASPIILFRRKAAEGWPVSLVSKNIVQFGYTAEEFLSGGINFDTIIHPDDLARVRQEVQTYTASGADHFQQEYRIITKDGETRWVDDRTVIERNDKGQATHYQGVLIDITPRKLAESALRQANNLLQTVLDTIPARVFWKDRQLRFLGCNHPFARDAGLNAPEDVVGKDDYQMGWREQADRYRRDDRQVLESGKPKLDYEEPQTTPDGRRIWLRTSKVPLRNAEGVIWGVLGTYEDITERKQVEEALRESEEKFRSIVENALVGIFIIDDQFRFVYANDELCHILRYPREELIGLDFRKVLAADSYHLVVDRYRRRQRGEQAPPRYELTILCRDGAERLAEMSVVVVRDAAGKARSIGQIVDITDRKRAELEREKLIADLEAKNAELERFTYTVSHDLKSPLVTIRGFLGYLEKSAAEGNLDQLRADIARIHHATERMQRLLNDLLELSRIGRMMNPMENLSFEAIAREAVELVRGQIDAGGALVEIHPNLPMIRGDRARLVEVVQNLVDNAVKFMGNQPAPKIVIGQQGEENGKPVLFVRDNGRGIAPEFHAKIFGLFNKLDPQSEGTGVGLALVKRIIELHGGQIWLESDGQNHGATFFFTLPPAI